MTIKILIQKTFAPQLFALLFALLFSANNQAIAQTTPNGGFVGCATGNENVASSSPNFEAQVLELVNIERKKRRLKPLALAENLSRAARYHAKDMAEDDYFNHNTYDRIKGTLVQVNSCGTFDRARKFAPEYGFRAENISAGQTSPADVMKAWMSSTGHKANILSKNYTHIGIGYYNTSKSYQHYWTQCFGGK
jgi:uncharacterized protein YkwD